MTAPKIRNCDSASVEADLRTRYDSSLSLEEIQVQSSRISETEHTIAATLTIMHRATNSLYGDAQPSSNNSEDTISDRGEEPESDCLFFVSEQKVQDEIKLSRSKVVKKERQRLASNVLSAEDVRIASGFGNVDITRNNHSICLETTREEMKSLFEVFEKQPTGVVLNELAPLADLSQSLDEDERDNSTDNQSDPNLETTTGSISEGKSSLSEGPEYKDSEGNESDLQLEENGFGEGKYVGMVERLKPSPKQKPSVSSPKQKPNKKRVRSLPSSSTKVTSDSKGCPKFTDKRWTNIKINDPEKPCGCVMDFTDNEFKLLYWYTDAEPSQEYRRYSRNGIKSERIISV